MLPNTRRYLAFVDFLVQFLVYFVSCFLGEMSAHFLCFRWWMTLGRVSAKIGISPDFLSSQRFALTT